MKNSNFIKNSIFALLPISLGLGVIFCGPSEKVSKADAYNFASLPTTISLKDNTETEIRNYYSSLNSKSASQKRGNNLLINLKTILSNGQNYFTYDKDSGGRQIWQMYEITDRDWAKSPASAINGTGYGTYNSSTNTITGYKYGNASNPATNPYLHSLYVNRDADNPKIAWGYHGSAYRETDARCVEREHIWPKSFGFQDAGMGGARGDPMHLWAADGYANGLHNNNPYGYVDKSKKYSDSGDNFSFTKNNLLGKSLNFSNVYNGSVFEPQDSDKGDIARACFYMAARYNNLSGTDSSISTDNPYLLLSDSPTNETGTSTSTQGYSLGFVSDLLEWNRLDPVDEYERHRNNLLFNNYTNNRNPFIDFPQWADMIWGDSESSADPENDSINNGQSEVVCTKLEMTHKPNKLSYSVGETINTTGMVITAYFSNGLSSVVNDYEISPSGALKTSNKELTVTYMGKSTSCSITVTGEDIDVPDPTVITALGLNLGDYANGTSSLYGVSWVKLRKGNANTIQGHADRDSQIYNYISNGYGIDSITLTVGYEASEKNYAYVCFGDTPATTDNQVKIGAGTSYRLDQINTFTIKNPGNAEYFNIVYGGGAAYFSSIEIKYKKVEQKIINVESVTLNETDLELEIGDKLTLVATINPSNATNKEVTFSSSDPLTVSVTESGAISAIKSGTVKITVSSVDGDKKAYCDIVVKAPVVVSNISISSSSTQCKTFFIGEEFNSDGLIVNANYSDGTKIDVSDEVEVVAPSMNVAGTPNVSVTYSNGKETFKTSYKITITDQNLSIFDFPSYNLTSGSAVETLTDSSTGFKTLFGSGTNKTPPKYYTSGASIRFYGANTLCICGPKKIVAIKLIFDVSDADYTNAFSVNTGSYSETNGVNGYWTGNADLVQFEVLGTSGQRRVKKVYVVYDSDKASNLYKGLTISGDYKKDYFVGDSFSSEGLIATAQYYDETTKVVTPQFSGFSSATTGDKTITVSYTEGGRTFSDTYTITVTEAPCTLSSISLSGTYKKEFFKDDAFTYQGLVVTAHYSDGSSDGVSGFTVSTPNMSVVSDNTTVTVSYTEDGVTKSETYSIKVIRKLVSISVDTKCKDEYFVGDTFDPTGLVVTAHYNDNTSQAITPEYVTPALSSAGTKTINLSYKENNITVSTTLVVYVRDIIPVEMSLSGNYPTEFSVGDEFSYDGLVVTITLNNGQTRVVQPTSVSGYNMNQPGEQVVTVRYVSGTANLSKTYTITVEAEEILLESISLSGNYKKEFFVGDNFDYEGLVVTAHYSDGSTLVVDSFDISGYNKNQVGNQVITVSYSEDDVTVRNSYNINVKSLDLVRIVVSGSYKTEYEYGENFTSSGLVVTAHYSNETSKVVLPTSISGYNSTKPGYQIITVSYKENDIEKQTTYQVKVKVPVEPEKSVNVALIGGIAGGVVALGGGITAVCVIVSKKRKVK